MKSDRKIEWVRTKDGRTFNIDSQDGMELTGHTPGIRGGEKIFLDECERIEYAKEAEEAEVST